MRMVEKEIAQEASTPVQSRVNLITLAELDQYWSEVQGVEIESMSQLINWSLEMAKGMLENNGVINRVGDGSLSAAHYRLVNRKLYQNAMRMRGRKKLSTALGAENMRSEGVNPADYAPTQYKYMHKKGSVSPAEIQRGVEIFKQIEKDEEQKQLNNYKKPAIPEDLLYREPVTEEENKPISRVQIEGCPLGWELPMNSIFEEEKKRMIRKAKNEGCYTGKE